jgi:hypothetical protein
MIMKTFLRINLVVLVALASALAVFGQSNEQTEQELLTALKELRLYSAYGGPTYDEEKLRKAQGSFEQQLLKQTKNPATLNYGFAKLQEQMSVATSSDGRLRVYSWDLEDGGTMHRYGRVYQFQAAEGNIYSIAERSPAEGMSLGFVTDIYAVDAGDSKIYIVVSTVIASGKLHLQSADLYKIEGGKLNDNVRLFQTRSGLSKRLRFEYDNFSVIDRKDGSEKLVVFDDKTSPLKIPVVIKDSEYPDGRVTDRSISYRFDGKHFVKVG